MPLKEGNATMSTRRLLTLVFGLLAALPGARCAAEEARSFYIWGEVQKPGAYPWHKDLTFAQAIQDAGGFTQAANRSRATLTRKERETTLTHDDLFDTSVREGNTVQPNDVIRIERGALRVEGEVRSPGEYGLEHNTVRQALIAAGGPTAMADLDAVYIARGGKVIRVDARKILTGGAGVENPTLEPGDVLRVPRAENRVTIAGEVHKPGAYGLVPGKLERLQDLIDAAGGFTNNARLDQIKLYQVQRLSETSGARGEPKVINMQKVSRTDVERNPVLESGDYVYVPPKRRGGGLGINEVYQIGILVLTLVSLVTR